MLTLKSFFKIFPAIFKIFILTIFMLGSVLTVTPAHAAGITVTTSLDNTNTDSSCSLREAITNANNDVQTYSDCPAGSGTDTITIGNTVYGVITLVGSELPIVTTTIIINGFSRATSDGIGTANTIIQANALPNTATYRIFEVSNTGNLTINNLTVRNGYCGVSCSGGGILNYGTLTVKNSVFSDNTAPAVGGGIANTGTLNVTSSAFSGNSTTLGGGGIYNLGGVATITNSTFSGNSATGGLGVGGAIANTGTLTVTNSTLSGNSATAGGGVYRDSGTLTLQNTIVNNNTGGNCNGTIINGGHNMDSGTSCGWGSVSGSMSNTNPMLASLALNGGPTKTFALLTGSPAIDAGDDTICDDNPGPNNLDQRGIARPQGIHCDIGSYEYKTYTAGIVVNSNIDDTFVNLDLNSTCDLREAITNANNNLTSYPDCSAGSGTDTITFASNYTIVLVGEELPLIKSTIIINGLGVLNTIIRANNAFRVFEVYSTGNLTLDNLAVQNGGCQNIICSIGGGIYNEGILNLTNCSIYNNDADQGGGVFNESGSTMSVTNCSFSANGSDYGGGITNNGTLNVMNSTFSGNTSSNYGGGIYASGGTLSVKNSTFSGNTSPHGGGIANESSLSVTNSTFSGNNSVTSQGSDIYNGPTAATVTNSTFSGSLHGSLQNTTGTLTLKNTIVTSSTGANCSGTITNGGHNIESGTSCGWGAGSGSMSNTNPLLGPLTSNNGAPTQTFALLTGSPAINAGDDTICAAAPVSNVSQNGVIRPVGSHCDIGAFEVPYKLSLPLIMR